MSEASIHLLSGWSFPESTLAGIRHELIRQIPPQQHVVVRGGWSLGALLALHEVVSGRSAATHLILISGTARFCADDADWPGLSPANLRALQRQLDRAPREALAGFHRLCAGPEAPETQIAERVEAGLSLGLETLRAGLKSLETLDVRAALSSCRIPVLLLHGALDPVIPLAASEHLVASLPLAKLVRHTQAGHDLPLRFPEWIVEQTAQFLNSPT